MKRQLQMLYLSFEYGKRSCCLISKSDWVAIKPSKMTDFVLSLLLIIKNKNGSI